MPRLHSCRSCSRVASLKQLCHVFSHGRITGPARAFKTNLLRNQPATPSDLVYIQCSFAVASFYVKHGAMASGPSQTQVCLQAQRAVRVKRAAFTYSAHKETSVNVQAALPLFLGHGRERVQQLSCHRNLIKIKLFSIARDILTPHCCSSSYRQYRIITSRDTSYVRLSLWPK